MGGYFKSNREADVPSVMQLKKHREDVRKFLYFSLTVNLLT